MKSGFLPSVISFVCSVALAFLVTNGSALADAALSLQNQSLGNAGQAAANGGDPQQYIPTATNQYYSGTLTGVTVTATACMWEGANATSCTSILWPKASDLAVLIRKPTPNGPPGFYTYLLQIGGAALYHEAAAATLWLPTNSELVTTAGACATQTLGCAGGTPGHLSPCTGTTNDGGETAYVNFSNQSLSSITMDDTTEVVLAWLPNGDFNTPSGSTNSALFCSIDVTFTGVTMETAPPCANPTYRDSSNCSDPCTCATANNPTNCGLPSNSVHAVELRFVNRSGFDASQVKLLPYSCAKSFATTTNPGVLYKDAELTHLLWRDGLFSAQGVRSESVNGCGHGPGWDGGACSPSVFNGQGPQVPMRTLRLSDLTDNGDGSYSLWTNHFPDAIWYLGLPQKSATGEPTTVPEVPFFVPLSGSYQQTDTIEINGLLYTWRANDSSTNMSYFAPPSPAAGMNSAPWAVVASGDCETTVGGCISPANQGVDWQQIEITMDGSPADIADITYIDFANVPLRLESFYSATSTTSVEASGFSSQTGPNPQHSKFMDLVTDLETYFPKNLYPICPSTGSPYAVQSAGPNQTDQTCGDSPFIPVTYPAHSTSPACALGTGTPRTINDFRSVYDHMLARTPINFPGHPNTSGVGWIRDWLGSPTSSYKFDYDFVLVMTKDTATQGQTSYTATLKGTVKVWNGTTLVYSSHPLTIVLGTDTYYSDTTKDPILDLTRSIYLAPTPGNMPLPFSVPSNCTSQALGTLSLCGPSDTQAGSDPRLSQEWLNVMSQIDISINAQAATWFGARANQNVTALIGRLMGDACAGFALGFLASDLLNPIIPAGGLSQWPSYGNTYPTSDAAASTLCDYDGSGGEPFWKTPSSSWWGGALFPTNGNSHFWSSECAAKIFTKHYNDVAPSVDNNFMCSGWGQLLYDHTDGGYSHPIEDRMNGYKAGINGYEYAGQPITRLDINFWRGISWSAEAPIGCVADINSEVTPGTVDGADLAALIGQWSGDSSCAPKCSADLNRDNKVDASDLTMMLGAWGACPP